MTTQARRAVAERVLAALTRDDGWRYGSPVDGREHALDAIERAIGEAVAPEPCEKCHEGRHEACRYPFVPCACLCDSQGQVADRRAAKRPARRCRCPKTPTWVAAGLHRADCIEGRTKPKRPARARGKGKG